MPEGKDVYRCIICGKTLHNPLSIYCSECEYELKRARLADEENVEEWIERMRENNTTPRIPEGVKTVDEIL